SPAGPGEAQGGVERSVRADAKVSGRSPDVAYLIELHQANVEPYLADAQRISPAVREILQRGLDELAEHAEFYLTNPTYRIPSTPYFHFDRILRDRERGKLRGFYFVVSDEATQFGVLRIVYMDEKSS